MKNTNISYANITIKDFWKIVGRNVKKTNVAITINKFKHCRSFKRYSDVIMRKSPASRVFTQLFIEARIKENIKAPRHWPLCGEFTGDRWIPRTKSQ